MHRLYIFLGGYIAGPAYTISLKTGPTFVETHTSTPVNRAEFSD